VGKEKTMHCNGITISIFENPQPETGATPKWWQWVAMVTMRRISDSIFPCRCKDCEKVKKLRKRY
jgi:hypothetical protein